MGDSRYSTDDDDDELDDSLEDDSSSSEDKRLGNRDDYAVDELRQQNERLAQRVAAQEWREFQERKQAVAARYEEAKNEIRTAEDYLAKAIAEANGDDAATALRFRDDVRNRQRELEREYRQLEQTEKSAQQAAPQRQTDPATNKHAKEWVKKHSWYDVNGRDEDSRLVLEIDTRLAAEGYVPRTELYWKELDKRVRKNLPHRFESEERKAAPKKNTIYISQERKEALIAAGVWDDHAMRSKYVKQYQKWDKENQQGDAR